MASTPRQWEDYLPGSSDNPRTGYCDDLSADSTSLEARARAVNVKKIDPTTGRVNVAETNALRTQIALDKRLTAVVTNRGTPRFRIITYDREGLLCIGYDTQMPSQIQELTEQDSFPVSFVAPYLRVSPESVDALIAEGTLRRVPGRVAKHHAVYLADLNRHKSGS